MSDIWAGKRGQDDAPAPGPEDELWAGNQDRARRRRRRGGDRRIQLAARIALPVLVLTTLAVGITVAIDLLSVRGSLQQAEVALRELRSQLSEVDLDRSAATLAVAREEIADAHRRVERPTWAIASRFPVVGTSVQVTHDVVQVAAAAVEVADIAVTDGSELLGAGVSYRIDDGRMDLAPFARARELIDSMPVERLVTARDTLAEPRSGWLPEQIRVGRDDVLALADGTIQTIQDADALADALPGFLGADGPRSYFVGFQTSAELRGTGGMVGFWGVLSVDDGQVQFGRTEDYDPFDDARAPTGETRTSRIHTIGLSLQNPPDVDPAYYARYGFASGARSFPNINLDPDLPTTAKAILDLFELQTGERLDGVVLLDPLGLEGMLDATGSTLPLPEELGQRLGFDGGLPVEEFARFVTADVYELLGMDHSAQRNDALRQIGDAAFLQVIGGGWESQAMARAVVEAASRRGLQVYTADPGTQEALHAVGATGSLQVPADADQFAVTANNIVGGKQDVHLGHELSFDIALSDVRRTDDDQLSASREVAITATVDNPLPTSGLDPYIIGSCYVPDRVNRCFEGEPGQNRTWFSVWASPLLRVDDFRSDDGTRPSTLGATYRELRVVDHLHLTDAGSRASFGLMGEGRTPLRRGVDSVVYEFRWWRQAKAIPDLLDVRISPPPGWGIDRLEVVGGGDGRGMGVHGDGEELDAELVDGVAHLRGTVSADTRLLVHLVDADTVDGAGDS